jgi:hypothetical protein
MGRPPDSPTVAAPRASRTVAEIERHLHRAGVALGGDRRERGAPVVEVVGVGEHGAEVDAAGAHEVEVVLHPVLADAFDLLDAEGVGAHPADLLEVERAPFPATRRVDAALDERPPRLEQADADLERLRLPDRVVHDVHEGREGHRQSGQRLPQHAARPRRELLDDPQARLVGEDDGGPELPGQLLLALEAGDHGDLDVGIQRPQDGDGAAAERAGAVDDHLAAGGRWMAGDRVERDRERIGEDGDLVGDVVGDGEHHRAGVGGHEVGVAAGGVAGDAGVDAVADLAVGEVPAEAVVALVARRALRLDAAGAAGEPRVQDDALAHVEAPRPGAELGDVGDDLVSHHLGEGAEGGHRVVALAVAEVHEDLLRVRAADPRHPGLEHRPVGSQGAGVGEVTLEAHGRRGQVLEELVVRVRDLLRLRRSHEVEHERAHGAS